MVCERDELRPSGEDFIQKLRDADLPAVLYLEPGAGHGHINEPADPTARPTIEAMIGWISGEGAR